MRILFFYSGQIGALGGAPVGVLARARAAARTGHAAGIIEIAPVSSFGKRRGPEGLPVWVLPYLDDPNPLRPRTWVSFARSVTQFQSIVRDFRPDIVLVNFPMWQSLPVVGAHCFPHRWRLIVTLHGSDIAGITVEQPKLKRWQQRLFRRADRVIAVSEALLEEAISLYPCLREKGEVIQNGLPSEWFEDTPKSHPLDPTRYVLYVGRLHAVKGVDLLLRAWSLLANQRPGELWLAGDGPALESLRKIANSLRIEDTVRFLGRLEREKLPAIYRNAEFVVLPSHREGMSLVTLEAGACRAICIATAVGGSVEVIENEVTGFLVEPESPEALARAMLRVILLGAERRERMKDAARERIRRYFSSIKMNDHYEQLYRSMAANSTKQTG